MSVDRATSVTPRDLGFDPSDPAFIADPYPVYRRLRDEHPILWNPETGQWLLSRHADVNRLLRDRRLGRTYLHQATHAEMGRPEPPAWHAPFHELNDAGMLDLEPPDHTRIRRLVLRAFTPRTVEAMRTRIQAVVDDLIDGFEGAGEVDLIADFAEPLPVTVIAELLGIPDADRHHLRPWSADMCLMYELDPSDPGSTPVVQLETAMGAAIGVFEGARALHVPRRRFAPVKTTNDLLALRSDAYVLLEDHRVELAPSREEPPVIDLEPDYYKLVGDFEPRFPAGPPSLVECERLTVTGDVTFGRGVVVRGTVTVEGPAQIEDGAELT